MFGMRKKLSFFLIPFAIMSMFFIFYQIVIFNKLASQEAFRKMVATRVLGTHKFHVKLYQRLANGKFRCLFSRELIHYAYVNDNYCDCVDGTDEPGTNACPGKTFFCTSQASHKGFKKIISSNKVNDGVCDCCDGSDEYLHRQISPNLDRNIQEEIGKYMSPCPVVCPNVDE